MRVYFKGVICLVAVTLTSCAAPAADDSFRPEQIIGMERAALERWGKGDPDGYFEIMAPEVVYFDPTVEARIDGLDALKKLIEPYRGKIFVGRFDMQRPNVQRRGDTAVLTFNLISYQTPPGGPEKAVARWNSTEVYSRIGPDVDILQFTPAGPLLCVRPYCSNQHYWQVYFDANRLIRESFGQAGFPAPMPGYAVTGTMAAPPYDSLSSR